MSDHSKTVTIDNIRDLHGHFLDMLMAFDKLCRDNGITYYLGYGALLGTVRDGDFIPWDDDVDVILTRDNYEKLKKIPLDSFEGLSFKFPEDSDYFYDFFPQIIDTRYVLKRIDNQEYATEEERYDYPGIDLMILDSTVNDFRRVIQRYLALFIYALARGHRRFDKELDWKNKSKFLVTAVKIVSVIGRSMDLKWIHKLRNRNATHFNRKTTGYLFPSPSMGADHIYPAEWFKEPSTVILRGKEFPAPSKVHEFLSYCYGDYMVPPPESERNTFHFDITV